MIWIAVAIAQDDWTPERHLEEALVDLADTRVVAISPDERAVVGQAVLDDVCFTVEGGFLSCTDEVGQEIQIVKPSLGG